MSIQDELRIFRPDIGGIPAPKKAVNWTKADAQRMHGLLLWALYHHQGGSSSVGQPIRRALGIGQHDHMTPEQIEMAKVAGSLPFNAI